MAEHDYVEDTPAGRGKFAACPHGKNKVTIALADGEVRELEFEGAFVIAGITETGAVVGTETQIIGTAAGAAFCIALVLQGMAEQMGVAVPLTVIEAMQDAAHLANMAQQGQSVQGNEKLDMNEAKARLMMQRLGIGGKGGNA